jgi:hypothetical protein
MWGHLFIVSLLAAVLFFILAKTRSLKNRLLQNALLSVVSLGYVLLASEFAFMFIPKSSNSGKVLSAKIWEKYWWRENSDGFRDEEFSQKDNIKKKLVFIGDSFTAGQGIKNPENRFSNLVAQAVEDSFEMYNMGQSGSNTEGHAALIQSLSFTPDIIVYQFFVDDIKDTRIRIDGVYPHTALYDDCPSFLVPLIEHSYFLNYIYWMYPHSLISDYKKYLADSYESPRIAQAHGAVNNRIIEYCMGKNIRLVYLFIPLPSEYEFSNQYYKTFEKTCRESGCLAINISAALEKHPVSSIIINRSDYHLNEKGNKLVASEILRNVFGLSSLP